MVTPGLLKGNIAPLVLAILALLCLTVLVALHDISGDVAVPIMSGLALGGLGHANGYRQGAGTNGSGKAGG